MIILATDEKILMVNKSWLKNGSIESEVMKYNYFLVEIFKDRKYIIKKI